MFEHQSHSFVVQAVALWASFVPPAAILVLIAGAQIERLRRRKLWRDRVSWFYRCASIRNRVAAEGGANRPVHFSH